MKKIVALDDPRWNWRKATNDRKSLSPDEAEVLWRSLEHAILTIKDLERKIGRL